VLQKDRDVGRLREGMRKMCSVGGILRYDIAVVCGVGMSDDMAWLCLRRVLSVVCKIVVAESDCTSKHKG